MGPERAVREVAAAHAAADLAGRASGAVAAGEPDFLVNPRWSEEPVPAMEPDGSPQQDAGPAAALLEDASTDPAALPGPAIPSGVTGPGTPPDPAGSANQAGPADLAGPASPAAPGTPAGPAGRSSAIPGGGAKLAGRHDPAPAGLAAVLPYLAASRGEGDPLPAAAMLSAPDAAPGGLSRIRVHADAAASRAAMTLRARAFTSGDDIYFRAGQYDPASAPGSRLLAHELAHVAEQRHSPAARPLVQLAPEEPELPQPVTMADARWEVWGKYFHYLVRDEIQWHYPVVTIGPSLDLIVVLLARQQAALSSALVADRCVAVLASAIKLPWAPDGRQGLVMHLAQTIDSYKLLPDARFFKISVEQSLLRTYFDPDAWDAYWDRVFATLGLNTLGALIAAGSFSSAAATSAVPGGAGARPADGWGDRQAREINRMLADARARQPALTDLPDRVVAWRGDRGWHLNVWWTVGSKAVPRGIPLIRGESLHDLFVRVREATPRTVQPPGQPGAGTAPAGPATAGTAPSTAAAAGAAPAWAAELLRALDLRLSSLRLVEPSATDLPDGISLFNGAGWSLRVWVKHGADDHAQLNERLVPVSDRSTVAQLVPYLRRLAALLRQFEHDPADIVSRPLDATAAQDPASLALAAFPARLVPGDLRRDRKTVTGAQNQFHMVLDFEAVYGGGPLADLFVASKLQQQAIGFTWLVHRIPDSLSPRAGEYGAEVQWSQRWQELNKAFNPADTSPQQARLRRPDAGLVSYQAEGQDYTTRVEFPSEASEAGDYLVHCITRHAPVGEYQLSRQSSEAFYPVRVEPTRQVAEAVATEQASAVKVAEAELDVAARLLAGNGLDPGQRQILLARSEFRRAYLERSRRKEALSLAEGTAAEIEYARQTQARVRKLQEILPGLTAKAKAQGVAPSALLTDDHDLFTLYWFIIGENKTVDGYAAELADQIGDLISLSGRAAEFSDRFKIGSRHQYSVTAAMVSEVTGQVYPLIMMLGEAPDAVIQGAAAAGGRIPTAAYCLVDVTAPETQNAYYGYGYSPGPAGHREAIDDAFKNFGSDATYGEGTIAVRIAPGPAGTGDPSHPDTETRFYRSKEGLLQKVLWALGIVAAVAGLAALAATGVGAPAAAGIFGAVAGVAGAITSLHNIEERSRRNRLEWDAALALDVLGIVSAVPAVMGARIALGARSVGGLQYMTATARFVKIYGWTEMGATAVLIPVKLAQDLNRIERSHLGPAEKAQMIEAARLGALESGLMLVGSAAAAHIGRHESPGSFQDDAALTRQVELLELEGFGEYQSMEELGWVDAHDNWTQNAPEIVRPRPAGPPALAQGQAAPAAAAETTAPAQPPARPAAPAPAPAEHPEPPARPAAEDRQPPAPAEQVTAAPAADQATPAPADQAGPAATPAEEGKQPGGTEEAKPAVSAQKPGPAAETSPDLSTREGLEEALAAARKQLTDLQAEQTEHNRLERIIREQEDIRAAATRRKTTGRAEREAVTEVQREAVRRRAEAAQELSKVRSGSTITSDIEAAEAAIGRYTALLDPMSRAPIPCLDGATPVLVPGGSRAIAGLATGDLVLAADPATGSVLELPVLAVHRNRTQHFLAIQFGNDGEPPTETVLATGRHRFQVEGAGWVEARQLVPGMRLRRPGGTGMPVTAVSLRQGDGESWNLTVARLSTYLVGPGVVVHNEGVDLGFGGGWIIYRGTNPDFPGKVYIGQTTLYDSKGNPRGTAARQQEHRDLGVAELAELTEIARQRPLTPKEAEQRAFFEHMENVELTELVTGIPSQALADYLEQHNIDFERDNVGGPDSVMNRREEIASPEHRDRVLRNIREDPLLGRYCPL